MGFVDTIKRLCERENITIAALEREMDFSQGSIRKWDESSPAYEKVKKVAGYFRLSPAELHGEPDAEDYSSAYADDVEMLHKNPELRVLLSASSRLTKSDVAAITEIALRMNRERDEE